MIDWREHVRARLPALPIRGGAATTGRFLVWLVGIFAVAGLVVALGRVIESQLVGITALDVPALGLAAAALVVAGIAACMAPAARAVATNPVDALKAE